MLYKTLAIHQLATMTQPERYSATGDPCKRLLPTAGCLHRAFRSESDDGVPVSLVDAAARMVAVQRARMAAQLQLREASAVSDDELRSVVGEFVAAEAALAALVTGVDRHVATALGGRSHVSGVWHTETVGLVIARMAGMRLDYRVAPAHEDAFRIARLSDAYNSLVGDLCAGRRLPPDM
ncbi:hypothetical protein [Nocardia blacklockiae]|uniref:hypothetical protein n=1 Tax=Nocardia blacklockiae TaxID=480036 RepID=UPI0018940B59|nr:hypothetical protein [Nocardia blacklockiae]MBF6175571.1 hypothetical protein [Nocardia blacklockiae]